MPIITIFRQVNMYETELGLDDRMITPKSVWQSAPIVYEEEDDIFEVEDVETDEDPETFVIDEHDYVNRLWTMIVDHATIMGCLFDLKEDVEAANRIHTQFGFVPCLTCFMRSITETCGACYKVSDIQDDDVPFDIEVFSYGSWTWSEKHIRTHDEFGIEHWQFTEEEQLYRRHEGDQCDDMSDEDDSDGFTPAFL